jgi:hypothetical protein
MSVLRFIEAAITAVAVRRATSCFLVAILALSVRLALLPILPEPRPSVHDEFSYILGGETFAMGRLTNPPHPLAPFFETYHVNIAPAYVSKYPPGQAMFLALGIRLFGDPWYGVWISVGLMCGLLTWMLQGWAPPKFALLGGLLTVPWFATSHYWMNSYWGGAVTACGGAMVVGALARLMRTPSAWSWAVGVTGIAVLANSRPFEGAVLTLASAAVLFQSHHRRSGQLLKLPIVLPAVGIALVVIGWIAFYNFRTTGSALTLPYSLNQRRYATTPIFWLEPTWPAQHREYRDPTMRTYWEVMDAELYTKTRRRPWLTLGRLADAASQLMSGAGEVLLWPMALSLLLLRLRRARAVMIIGAAAAGGFLLQKYSQPHYLSAATSVILVLAVFGLRLLRLTEIRGRPVGSAMLACIVGLALLATALQIKYVVASRATAEQAVGAMDLRRQVEITLNRDPAYHVVIVRYGDAHKASDEQVYNGPDIDRQKIVWAFDRGPAENHALLRYFAERKFWLFEPDLPHLKLEPYIDRESSADSIQDASTRGLQAGQP